ncbi:hypothetical protein [Micromonospora sp. NBC_01796]|uniref:hypothetical protein n=1 Tax=Micromonospora sp. NBC_01796 TaxID=2975987 RepID=UPI002DDA8861|nr:hypothetical protein [Micromonospora sp. NBC_01796]WSA88621.1 hypothetical protein OIE47_14010 [Micromonospora sp. NBC_01796]
MPDLTDRFADLAAEVDGMLLANPQHLRQRADRRSRTRVALVGAAATVAVAGVAVTPAILFDPPPPTPQVGIPVPTPTPTPTPSAAPTPDGGTPTALPPTTPPQGTSGPPRSPGRAASISIPLAAFFTPPPNTRKSETRVATANGEALPELCRDDMFTALDDEMIGRKAVRSLYKRPEDPADNVPHGTLYQTITAYTTGAAEQFMDEFATAAASCKSFQAGDIPTTMRTLPPPSYGDQAILLETDRPSLDIDGKPTDHRVTQRIVVVRVGDVVTVLNDSGWEGTSSIPALIDNFTHLAVTAINQWR